MEVMYGSPYRYLNMVFPESVFCFCLINNYCLITMKVINGQYICLEKMLHFSEACKKVVIIVDTKKADSEETMLRKLR